MEHEDFPALFQSSDLISNKKQKLYLWLLKGQFLGLIVAAFCLGNYDNSIVFAYGYLIFVAVSLSLLFWLISSKPEKDWYRFRALAESIKTRTWLFIMGAEPFDISKEDGEVRRAFAEDISEILASNQFARSKLVLAPKNAMTISDKMINLRQLTLDKKKEFYISSRIDEQCGWYEKKSSKNKLWFIIWSSFATTLYIISFSLILYNLNSYGKTGFLASPSIFLVAASGALAWMQIKKFNELAAAYALTAHEITLAKEKVITLSTEKEFSETVDEIELVFSREHTQWVARQQT